MANIEIGNAAVEASLVRIEEDGVGAVTEIAFRRRREVDGLGQRVIKVHAKAVGEALAHRPLHGVVVGLANGAVGEQRSVLGVEHRVGAHLRAARVAKLIQFQ